MRGAALALLGLWVILQTAKGPLAEKVGLIKGTAPVETPQSPGYNGGPPTGQTTQAACTAAGGTWVNGKCYASA